MKRFPKKACISTFSTLNRVGNFQGNNQHILHSLGARTHAFWSAVARHFGLAELLGRLRSRVVCISHELHLDVLRTPIPTSILEIAVGTYVTTCPDNVPTISETISVQKSMVEWVYPRNLPVVPHMTDCGVVDNGRGSTTPCAHQFHHLERIFRKPLHEFSVANAVRTTWTPKLTSRTSHQFLFQL